MAGWLTPALGLLIAVASGYGAESDGAGFTSRERLAETVFPKAAMARNYSEPSPLQLRAVDFVRRSVADQVGRIVPGWSEPLVGRALSRPEMARVKDALLSSPVYLCKGTEGCRSCRNPLGCALTQIRTGAVASVLVLHPCMVSRTPRACASVEGGGVQSNVQLLYRVIQEAAATIVLETAQPGALRRREGYDKVVEARGRVEQALSTVWQMVEACPGPLPDAGRGFLEKNGLMIPINDFWDRCGGSLLGALRRVSSVRECTRLLDVPRWRAEVEKGWLIQPVVSRRCNDFCELATCGGRASRSIPRVIRFRSTAVVSLPEGACEGAMPIQGRDFFEETIDPFLAKEIRQARTFGAMIDLCWQKIRPEFDGEPMRPSAETVPGITLDLID